MESDASLRPPQIEPDGLVTDALCIHSGGRIVYISEMSARWMGAPSAEALIGRPVTDLVPREQLAGMRNANLSLVNPGDRSPRIRSVVTRADGSTSDCELVVSLVEWQGMPAYQVEIYETAHHEFAEKSLEHQAAMIAHASDALIATTFNGFVTNWNPAAEKMFSCTAEAAIGSHITNAADPQLDPRAFAPNRGVQHFEIHRDDTVIWLRASASTMHNGYVLVCIDETTLRRAQQRVQAVLDSLDGGFVLVGNDGVVESINPAAQELLGTDPRGQLWDDVYSEAFTESVDVSGIPLIEDPTLVTRRSGTAVASVVMGYRRQSIGQSDGHAWVSLSCRRLSPEDPSDNAVLITVLDFTDHQSTLDELAYAASHDALTGLYNRAYAVQVLTDSLTAEIGTFSAVMFIDLDNLKTINDTLGHGAGDAVLRSSALKLLDSVGPRDVVARLGGDEFICLLTAASVDNLDAICNQMHERLSEELALGRTTLQPGASIGVRLIQENEKVDAATIFADADQAMYQAKAAGGNRTWISSRQ